jgi:hypothetical protein
MEVVGQLAFARQDWLTPSRPEFRELLEGCVRRAPSRVRDALTGFCGRPEASLVERAPRLPELWHGFRAFQILRYTRPEEEKPPRTEEAHIVWDYLRMHRALDDPGTTAIIAPNDSLGVRLLRTLDTVGLRVPQDISLLSFDNRYRYSFSSLSSIDPGFASLGYCAAHCIAGDVPIAHERGGDVVATPVLVRRRSLGTAQP